MGSDGSLCLIRNFSIWKSFPGTKASMNTGIAAPKTYSIIVTERHQASRERRDLLASFGAVQELSKSCLRAVQELSKSCPRAVQRQADAHLVGTFERQYPLHCAWQKDLISSRKLKSAGTTVERNSNTQRRISVSTRIGSVPGAFSLAHCIARTAYRRTATSTCW